MNNEFRKYFFDNGLMAPHGMNDILYTAEYVALGGDINETMIKDAINVHFDSNGKLLNSDKTSPISHDNLTALFCLCKKSGLPLPKFRPEHAYWHPRDFFFYLYATNPLIGIFFLWIPCLLMIESVLFDNYKTIDGQQVLATDGKLLTWLRINSFNLPITSAICNFIIKRKFGGWHKIFAIYFKDPNHPNNILSRLRYAN